MPNRPPLKHPKARILGNQGAAVTGPKGEEIHCNQYGRVKMQFHWDREGQADHKTSCWLRVSSAWAGAQYGGIAIPRIGMEVLVTFLEGDPRPTADQRLPVPQRKTPSHTPCRRTEPAAPSKP